jgi:hypothetical protein
MILLIVGTKQLNVWERVMSQFLDDARAILERVAQGNADTPQMKTDIAELKGLLTANTAADAENKAGDEEVKTLILEVLNKLAVSTPPEPTPEPEPEPD